MRRARLVLLAGAVLYSAWLIAPSLGSELSVLRSYVSEIGAAGQPFAKLFRATDILAGACFVVAAALCWGAARPSSRPARIALGGMVLLGVATICDALLPLSCTPTADTACAAREAAGLVPLTHAGHAFSSGAAGFGGVVAVVGWILWRRGTRGPNPPGAGSGASGPNRTRPGFDSALAALAAGIAYLAATGWTLAAMVEPALYLGLAQRLQILALTVWLALVALRPLPGRRR